jgi:hypothetical protein
MMEFIYIDLNDWTGGFMLPVGEGSEEIVAELLKDPKYVRREQGKETP